MAVSLVSKALKNRIRIIFIVLAVMCLPLVALSDGEEIKATAANDKNKSVDEISKELSNPVSSLYIFPFEYNFDGDVGPNYGKRNTLNIEPVIPVNLGKDWKVIIRTIIPLVQQSNVIGDTSQKGIGDIEQSYFFSPQDSSATGPNKLIWGVGPVINIPIGNDDFSTKKWALGPAATVVMQTESWTFGGLAEQLWSTGGEGDRDINETMIQPFAAYHIKGGWTISGNVDLTYDWVDRELSAPLEVGVGKVVKLGGVVPLSIGLSPRYYLKRTDNDPRWGVKLMFVVIL
jgi:hypothetical protein